MSGSAGWRLSVEVACAARKFPIPLLLVVLGAATCPSQQCERSTTGEQPPARVRAALEARGGAALLLALPGKAVLRRHGNAALDEPHPTGSAIKPLTALLALEAGALQPSTEVLCRREVRSGGVTLRCAHPTVLLPFTVSEALTHSCNYFFAEAGRRLGREALERGFRQAGIAAEIHDPALGATGAAGVRATPRQLLDVLVRLAAGDFPFRRENMALVRRALEAAVREGTASPAAVEGVAVAGKTGTAAWPGVSYRNSGWFAGWAPADRPQVAVVVWLHRGEGRAAAALAGELLRQHFARPAPASGGPSRLLKNPSQTGKSAPLVPPALEVAQAFLPAQSDAEFGEGVFQQSVSLTAELLRVELFSSVPITQLIVERPDNAPTLNLRAKPKASEMLRVDCPGQGCRLILNNDTTHARGVPPRMVQGQLEIRFKPGRIAVIHVTGLERYVAGVLESEASEIRHPESLKAMAVAARTFALRHRGRHAASGFDFCSLTHCQAYTSQASASPGAATKEAERFRAAAQASAGEVLRFGGELARTYYTGSCGGHTQAAGNVWPEEAAPYLPARPDPYCSAAAANLTWSTRLPAAQLEAALRGDRAADPGGRIRRLAVAARDSSGRVRQLQIAGSSVRSVNGNYFRFLVGRRLGWEKLKSTAFEVRREGGDFVFEGRGFGHGVGLCQQGAARMGEAGFDYRRILAQYFPGAKLGSEGRKQKAVGSRRSAVGSLRPANSNQLSAISNLQPTTHNLQPTVFPTAHSALRTPQSETLASEHFTLSFPAGRRADAEEVAAVLEAARRRFATRGIPPHAGRVPVVLYESALAFIRATGKPGWVAASADGRRLHVQQPALLRARGTLTSTLAHEYLHLALWDATDARIPKWFREGVALYFSGEQPAAPPREANAPNPAVTLEQAIERPRSRAEMRRAYARALEETRALARELGDAGLLRLLRQPSAAELQQISATARRPL